MSWDSYLEDLPHPQRKELCGKLDVSDWKSLAYDCGFNQTRIRKLEQAFLCTDGSPSDELLQEYEHCNPTLLDLCSKLKRLELIQCAEVLIKYVGFEPKAANQSHSVSSSPHQQDSSNTPRQEDDKAMVITHTLDESLTSSQNSQPSFQPSSDVNEPEEATDYKMQHQDLDYICEQDLMDLAENIGGEWILLCIHLRRQMDDKHPSMKYNISEMLCHWNANSSDITRTAKIDELRKALIRCGRRDLVRKNKLFREVADVGGTTLQTQMSDSEERETSHVEQCGLHDVVRNRKAGPSVREIMCDSVDLNFMRDFQPNLQGPTPRNFSQNTNTVHGQVKLQSGPCSSPLLKDTDEMSTLVEKDENDKKTTKKVDMDVNAKNTTYTVNTDENGGFYHMPNIKSQLYIPDGALAEETRMQIIEQSEETIRRETDVELKSRAISNIYEFLPHGQCFMKYVTFRFPLKQMHKFNVGGLKMLYSATGAGEEANWQEIPLITSRGAHSSGLSWLVWERHCFVMMQHFCKIQVITTDIEAQTRALYVNASLIGQYLEQLQLVEMHVLFSCGEMDDTDLRQKFDSDLKVLCENVVLLYENGGDLEMKLTLHNSQDWQVDEEEQSQVLDKNILFLEPLCRLKTLPKISFTIHQKQSTFLKGNISLKQNHRENGKQCICNLDVKDLLKNDTEEIRNAFAALQIEKDNLLKNYEKLQREQGLEREQKENVMSENKEMKMKMQQMQDNKEQKEKELEKSKDGCKKGTHGVMKMKKSFLPVAKSIITRETNACGGLRNDVAVASQASVGAAANCESVVHKPQYIRQYFPQNTGNKGTNHFVINNISYNYNESGKQDNLAIEDETWPTGFDREFRNYLFEFLVELDKDKRKLHNIAEELGIIHTNGFDAKELVTAWYVKSMAENNNNGDARTIWEDLCTILVTQSHAQAAEYLTLAIEKQRVRDNIEHFVNNLRMDYIMDKLFSSRLIDMKQKKDFQQEKLGVGDLITDVVLVADLHKFKAFKASLKETDQNVLLGIINETEEQ